MVIKKFISVLLLFFSLTVLSQENLHSSLTIPESLKEGTDAVVRLNDINVVIESRQEMYVSLKRIVTVFNEKGNRHVQAISGYNKYRKIKKIEAVIFDEYGKEIKKIKKNDFIDHSAVDGGTLYSDSRILFMGYTPIKYPYTVEFYCTLETPNTANIPSWMPVDDYFVSVENDRYSLIDNANLGLRFKEKNLDGFEIQKASTPVSINYSIKNVSCFKPEDLSPVLYDFAPQLLIAVEKFHYNGIDGKAKNWMEFGNWIKNSLLDGRDIVSEETKQKILEMVNGIDDPIEKAQKIFKFVQNNTRYISVQVGIGGIQPISALEVDQLKYGDCKGLTNYTQSLLKIANVESYYTVVEAGKQIVNLEDDFASLEQGNHIILGIPNKDKMVWLDCTSQIHPFDFIGDFTDNRNVLIVKQDSSQIIKTTVYQDTLNTQKTRAEINLNIDGSIDSDITIKTKGIQYDNRFFIERESNKNIIEYYKEYWGNVNNLEVEKYSFNNDMINIEFTEKVAIHAKNYGAFNGERLLFEPNAFNKNRFVPDRYRNRVLSLKIQRGYLDQDDFIISVPNGYEIESLPENIRISNEFGEYKVDFETENNKVIYNRKLIINRGNYPKAKYEAYRNFRKKISNGDSSKIVLKKI